MCDEINFQKQNDTVDAIICPYMPLYAPTGLGDIFLPRPKLICFSKRSFGPPLHGRGTTPGSGGL